jgi:hypothetical protein
MAQEPPSTQGSSQGTIYWALNDPYSKVLGKERSGRVNGVRFVHIPRSSGSTSRMPLGTCNDLEHAGIENLKKKMLDWTFNGCSRGWMRCSQCHR